MENTTVDSSIKLVTYHSKEYQQIVQLRYDVLRAPLGQSFSADFLARDANNLIIGAFLNEEVIGCCQLEEGTNGVFQLRQMAVSNQLQSGGIGTRIVQFAETITKQRGGIRIVLHAREVAANFYRKLGYTAVGDQFMEIGIPHLEMVKDL